MPALAAAWAESRELGVAVAVAVATGMRRGEVCGLRWVDVDLEAGSLRVVRNVVLVGGKVTAKDPKTHQARRFSIDAGLVAVLAEHRAAMVERARLAEVDLVDDAWVLSRSADGSVPLYPDSVSKAWKRVADAHGLAGMRLHDLRHLNATIQIDAGVPASTVAQRLGHATMATTLRVYAHAVAARDQEAADVIGRALDATKPPPGEGGGSDGDEGGGG